MEDAERMTRDEGTLAPLSYKAVHQNGGRAKWATHRSLFSFLSLSFSLFLRAYSQEGKYVNEALVPSCPRSLRSFEKNTNHRTRHRRVSP